MAQLDRLPILFDEIRDEDQAIENSILLCKRSLTLLIMSSLAWIVTNICKLDYRESRKIDLIICPNVSFIKKLLKSNRVKISTLRTACINSVQVTVLVPLVLSHWYEPPNAKSDFEPFCLK